MTRDGLFLIENGKVTTPVVNFRFNESPVRMLQNTIAMGTPVRTQGGESGMIAQRITVKDYPLRVSRTRCSSGEASEKSRLKMPPPSAAMAYWSSLLEREALEWPGVTVKPMFGMKSLYRGSLIFAVLPNQRALWSANSIGYKVHGEERKAEGKKWRVLELKGEHMLTDALARLHEAYEGARVRRKTAKALGS